MKCEYPIFIKVCGISTDKACKPINVMGMSKSLQERILTSANVLNEDTRFICVRYGNVLASRGSVIPLFRDQIRCGGPVTITLPNMTRFFMSLNDAVDTVFTALMYAGRGETYIPIVPSAKVSNIAKALIADSKVEIVIKGIRPGEKLHEILVSEEESHHCIKRNGYYVILPLLPEIQVESDFENALTAEYSSNYDVMDLESTIALLRSHSLLLSQTGLVDTESGLLC